MIAMVKVLRKKSVTLCLCCAVFWMPINGNAYTEPCQLVAQMAGAEYEARPNLFASLLPPSKFSEKASVSLVERNGAWFVYEGGGSWFNVDSCAPSILATLPEDAIEIIPVLINIKTGKSAVVTGLFLIKVYKEKHLGGIANRYHFKKISTLPNRFTAIFDVRPQTSYDALIEYLDRERDIEWIAPLLSEPN